MKPGKRPPLTFAETTEPADEAPAAFAAATPKPVREPAGWPLYLLAALVSLAWLAAPAAYAYRYHPDILQRAFDPFVAAALAGMAVGPIALIWFAVYVLRQGMKLAAEARRHRALAMDMLAPAALASAETGTVIEAVRRQVDAAGLAAGQVSHTMLGLREALAHETERLNTAAATSSQTAARVAGDLDTERQRLTALAQTLEEQAAAICTGADRAAEATTAADQATGAARTASEDLARHVARLEEAGAVVGEQLRAVEAGISTQHRTLAELAGQMRGEQEGLTADFDTRTARLTELVAHSRTGAGEVSQSAQQGAEAIQHLTAAAAQQFAELSEAAQREREALAEAMRASIGEVTAAAEEARRAADAQADAARSRIDQMNEAAFDAARKADEVFESRLTQARGLIEQSAQMVDDAGDKARERLEGWIAAARETLGDVDRMLSEISTRAHALPAEAEQRADALRVSMEHNLGALVASAQKASEETKALDAAFQQRVRQNYEMLSEAVRLMGLVAGAEPPTAKVGQPGKAEPRIRLRPVASDAEFDEAMTAATGEAPEPQDEGLGWKGLLESLDRDGADPENLSERMVAELKALGVDTEAMLPKVKIDGIAAAVQAGDLEGARQVVRNLGGQTVEKVSRRLFADAAVRGQAERYRRRFAAMLIDARDRDHEGFLVASLLASEEGRAWLILDAAAGSRA